MSERERETTDNERLDLAQLQLLVIRSDAKTAILLYIHILYEQRERLLHLYRSCTQ